MTYCAEHGCKVLVVRGRCHEHARSIDRDRGTFRERGYTTQWDRRARAFKARYPLCGMRPEGLPPVMSECHDEGRTTLATHVDHVVPHHGDVRLMWDERHNWQSLCAPCHTKKTVAGL